MADEEILEVVESTSASDPEVQDLVLDEEVVGELTDYGFEPGESVTYTRKIYVDKNANGELPLWHYVDSETGEPTDTNTGGKSKVVGRMGLNGRIQELISMSVDEFIELAGKSKAALEQMLNEKKFRKLLSFHGLCKIGRTPEGDIFLFNRFRANTVYGDILIDMSRGGEYGKYYQALNNFLKKFLKTHSRP